MEIDASLRAELLAMLDEDEAVRAELAADGSLFAGYHPRMAQVHRRNAARLTRIMAEYGWPGGSLAGEDGAWAAWIVLQHAIDDPPLQRRGLELLKLAGAQGDVPLAFLAMLEDRIRFFEGRPQVYGTQFDWDEHGQMSPTPIENAEGVDALRRSVGLEPLEERIRQMREGVGAEKPPADLAQRRRQQEEWARSVGWRE
jgi:hypothetical protein